MKIKILNKFKKINISNKTCLIYGFIIGLILGVGPFFVDVFCHSFSFCEKIFLFPVNILLKLFGRFIVGRDIAIVFFIIGVIFYPLLGILFGLLVNRFLNFLRKK